MLITCPECGKEISGHSTHCIHCGYPLQKTDEEKAVQDSGDAEQTADNTIRQNEKRKRKPSALVISLCILAIAVISFGVYILLNNTSEEINNTSEEKEETIKSLILPYGIKPEMTLVEAKKQMIDSGFEYNFQKDGVLYFNGDTISGVKSWYTSLSSDQNAILRITLSFEEDENYSWNNPSPNYNKIKNEFISKYGEPTETNHNGNKSMCGWENGRIRLTLAYSFVAGKYYIKYEYVNK